MKLVINKCFGGFSLSPEALKKYAATKNQECFFFLRDVYGKYGRPVNPEEHPGTILVAFDIPNPDEQIPPLSAKWLRLSSSQQRDDPDLVKVVEEIGSERASGICAKLAIVEIPDDVEWEISENDGLETVREKHRSRR